MARPKSPCFPATLYRLTGAAELSSYLLAPGADNPWEESQFKAGDVTCLLRYGQMLSDGPFWAAHIRELTGHPLALARNVPFAVLLIDQEPFAYALTWGDGYALLNDEYIEQGFGLAFAAHRLDDLLLSTVTTTAVGASARILRTSFPGGNDLRSFRIEPFADLVGDIRGKADLTGLTYGNKVKRPRVISAKDSLQLPLGRTFGQFLQDLSVVADVVDGPQPNTALRFIGQMRPLKKGHRLINILDPKLDEVLGGQADATIGVSWPMDVSNIIGDAQSFRLSSINRERPALFDRQLELEDFLDRLADIPAGQRVERLRTGRVQCYADEDGKERLGPSTTAGKWIAFETDIESTRYVFHTNKWYRLGDVYVQRIRDEVADLLSRRCLLSLPHWIPTGERDDEYRYCKKVADEADFLCLDRNFAQTPFNPQLELCDLVGPAEQLIHVKWLGSAPAFSHLVAQAQASISSLLNEPVALEQLRQKVDELSGGTRSVIRVPSTIVLAAAGRKWDVKSLFLMSQISLLRFAHSLPVTVDLEFADIPYTPKPARRSRRR